MIRRTLVPLNVRPVANDDAHTPPQRLTTLLDSRTVVPSQLSKAPPLNGKSSIPAHLPLGVLVNRSLVPRGMEVKPFEKIEHASMLPLEILDSRMVVPADVNPVTEEELRLEEKPLEVTPELREVIQPDIFITGDANLLIGPEEKRRTSDDALKLTLSILFHVAVILLLILSPKMFPSHEPTDEQIALAKRQLQWIYTPPPAPRVQPSPKIRISPKVLNSVAPPVVQPPAPPVEKPATPEPPRSAQLPPEPTPQNMQRQPQQANPPPSQLEAVQPPVPRARPHLNLGLSNNSPGQEIQNQMQDAIRSGHSQEGYYGGAPAAPGAGGPGMGQGYQILSDTQGVDFTSYIQRLLATLKRNWVAVMPESAYLGDRGIVYTTFQINPDGSVPPPDPILERTSGKLPLDNAAMSAIHASNPFEPLPAAFHGPYLRLRIVFLYNVTPAQAGLP
ncbi:MAG: TonB C-terminal domain-containing protein [Acidobacteriota bacterium]|nr:TonB C-terminal domain-containing protein [Acidobacteriota bacterium]